VLGKCTADLRVRRCFDLGVGEFCFAVWLSNDAQRMAMGISTRVPNFRLGPGKAPISSNRIWRREIGLRWGETARGWNGDVGIGGGLRELQPGVEGGSDVACVVCGLTYELLVVHENI